MDQLVFKLSRLFNLVNY